MTEPKYKKGDIIMRYDGVLLRIGWFESAKGLYHGHVGDSIHQGWASDADIKCAVKIIPITDKPFCKDCKNFPEIGEEGYFAAYWSERKCPLAAWASQAVTPYGSRLKHSQTQIGNDNYDIETLQPPDDCYCFVPKELK